MREHIKEAMKETVAWLIGICIVLILTGFFLGLVVWFWKWIIF